MSDNVLSEFFSKQIEAHYMLSVPSKIKKWRAQAREPLLDESDALVWFTRPNDAYLFLFNTIFLKK
jgi:hypothetical protein